MKIVIAPDSFKESASAEEIAAAMQRGVLAACPQAETVLLPMSDGGEGFSASIMAAIGGQSRRVRVCGPLGERVEAEYALLGDARTAVIDMAACAGMTLVPPEKRNPLHTTTYGVGEMLLDALEAGAREIIVGLGGSATIDGACGMAQALGAVFFNDNGKIAAPIYGGILAGLQHIDANKIDKRLSGVTIRCACDVTNPLLGPLGAARIYGPQKGADAEAVSLLETGLARLAALLPHTPADFPGAGAAGGMGFGLAAFMGVSIERGAELLMDVCALDEKLAGADLLLTGEGRLDGQTMHGKTCHALAERARAAGVPTLALVGSMGPGAESLGDLFAAVFSICDGSVSLAEAMRRVLELVERQARNAMACYLTGKISGGRTG